MNLCWLLTLTGAVDVDVVGELGTLVHAPLPQTPEPAEAATGVPQNPRV